MTTPSLIRTAIRQPRRRTIERTRFDFCPPCSVSLRMVWVRAYRHDLHGRVEVWRCPLCKAEREWAVGR